MYPSERYMNRSRPKGNIGENYLLREAIATGRRNFEMHAWEWMYDETLMEVLIGQGNPITFTAEIQLSAHIYVLQYIPEVEPWRRYGH
jgi:hypothetical protein